MRLPGADPSRTPEPLARLLQEQEREYGRPFESTAILAHRPSIALAWEGMFGAIAESGRLADALSGLVNRRVARRVGCSF